MKKIHRILLVHTGGLGDLIMARPAIQAVRRKYGESRIDFLGNPGPLQVLASDPWTDERIPFPSGDKGIASALRVSATLLQLRRRRYDLLLLLQPVLSAMSHKRLSFLLRTVRAGQTCGRRSAYGPDLFETTFEEQADIHETERMLLVAGGSRTGTTTEDYLLPKALCRGEAGLPAPGPYAVIAPGGSREVRRWDIEKYLELAGRFLQGGLEIVMTGSQAEKNLLLPFRKSLPPGIHDVIGRTRFGGLAALLSRAELVVSNDSGSMHLANALGKPVVAIFGSGDAVRTGPYLRGNARIVDSGPLPCKPCSRDSCGDRLCMRQITVDEVWRAAAEIASLPGRRL